MRSARDERHAALFARLIFFIHHIVKSSEAVGIGQTFFESTGAQDFFLFGGISHCFERNLASQPISPRPNFFDDVFFCSA